MNKKKSAFVTALVAVMLAAILIGLHTLNIKIFFVLVGILAVYGYLVAASNFCRWLGKEPVLLPAHVRPEKEDVQIDVNSFDDILAEMRGETV